MTHAFFKALLFLGAGSVIHGMSGEQDIRKMGGLRKKMPITFWTFLIGALAIAGVPGFAGFFARTRSSGTPERERPLRRSGCSGVTGGADRLLHVPRCYFLDVLRRVPRRRTRSRTTSTSRRRR